LLTDALGVSEIRAEAAGCVDASDAALDDTEASGWGRVQDNICWADGTGKPVFRDLIAAAFFSTAAVGVLAISVVQTRIARRHGWRHFAQTPFFSVYWRELSPTDRWLFWCGTTLLLLPFAVLPFAARF